MNSVQTQRGVSSLVIIVGIALFGGATLAVVNRNVLKSFFQTGDKPVQEQIVEVNDESAPPEVSPAPQATVGDTPTQAQFADTIDSDLNTIKAPEKQPDPEPIPLKNSSPTEGKKFSEAEAGGTITFRWSGLVPKPTREATYRLRVWQLMQGQTGAQAMKANKPVVSKDVSLIHETSVSGLYTGPCKPPYLCEFVWSVSVVNNGTLSNNSDPSSFSVLVPPPKLETEIQSETHTEQLVDHADGAIR